MFYIALKIFHVLAIVVWVGGMVFAHFFLRPALGSLDPPVRLRLMHGVLGRFFRVVLVLSLGVLASGVWMIVRSAHEAAQSGGAFFMPLAWSVMAMLGTVMVAIFLHIRFALYKRLASAVAAEDWPAGGAALVQIRQWVAVNLGLGSVILLVVLLHA